MHHVCLLQLRGARKGVGVAVWLHQRAHGQSHRHQSTQRVRPASGSTPCPPACCADARRCWTSTCPGPGRCPLQARCVLGGIASFILDTHCVLPACLWQDWGHLGQHRVAFAGAPESQR